MPACCVLKPSPTFYRQVLTRKILKESVAAIIACFFCAYIQILCIFSASLSKCAKYIYKRMPYNRSFSKADYNRLLEKEMYLKIIY
jgi:hypothetical protein